MLEWMNRQDWSRQLLALAISFPVVGLVQVAGRFWLSSLIIGFIVYAFLTELLRGSKS